MKTILKYVLFAYAAVLGVACNNILEPEESLSFPETEIILTATREGLAPATRSFRLDDGSVWWNPAEEVSVFYGSGSNGGSKFVSMNTAIAETVELQGSVQMAGSGKDFWAVYPYSEDNSCDGSSIITVIPDKQGGIEGNFSDNTFPAVAKSSSLSLAFWNICGGIKFFVSRNDIKSVTFKGNNGESLAGKVKIVFNSSGFPSMTEVIDGKSEITLTATDEGAFKPGKYYYLTLLPAALDGGFTMTFNTDTEIGSVVSNNAQTVKRSVFGVLKNIDSKVSEWKSTIVGHEYVDLGLPSGLKWATMNVGATKPEEYGAYLAWGETEPYYSIQNPLTWKDGITSGYSWASYKWCNGGYNKLTKYCTQSSYWDSAEPMDNKTVLDTEDDAAHVNWGGSWRMPTDAEWTELRDNCTWTWTTQNGVKGRKVTGPNGNSIFLPAAGYRSGTNLSNAGSSVFYWSSSLDTGNPYYARLVYFYSDNVRRNYDFRYFGFSVRPVYDDRIHPESVSLNKSTLSLCVGDSEQLLATVIPDNATVKSVVWSSDNTDVATVDDDGNVTAFKVGTATITATTVDVGKTATCDVTVYPVLTDAGKKAEMVDLGLSVKWATFNIGASAPEEYGEYFAWGETEPKGDYRWLTYKWCNGNYSKLTKYCTDSSYWDSSSSMDNKTVLDLEDDAASVNWGGSWRMPTDAEWTELRDNCTWTWTTQNGVKGRKVTGPNGNSIFLPAAGDRVDTRLSNAGSSGYYWSSSLLTAYPSNAWIVYFSSDGVNRYYLNRYNGFSVRPVSE